MSMTLRTRLALLVVASIALSVGLALYLTWRMVGETMIRMEEKSFASLMLVEEESLNAAFMNQLAAKVSAVRDRKNQLKETAERASRELATLDKMLPKGESRENLCREMLKSMDSGEIRMELLHMSDLLAGGISRLGLRPDTPDAKQRSLKDILEHLPRSGDFAVMELPRSLTVAGSAFALTSDLERPALAFFLPLYGSSQKNDAADQVLVTLTSLEDLEIQAAASETALLEATREKFGSMNLYRHGFVALLNAQGDILASGGEGELPRENLMAALNEARQKGQTQRILPSIYGDLLCLVSYSRAFDWYTVMTAPLSEISVPSDALLSRLIAISLIIMLLCAGHAHALPAAAGAADAQDGRNIRHGCFRSGCSGKAGSSDGTGPASGAAGRNGASGTGLCPYGKGACGKYQKTHGGYSQQGTYGRRTFRRTGHPDGYSASARRRARNMRFFRFRLS